MNKNKIRGQEAVEFVLIAVLVFLAALFTIFLFGQKISNFFTTDSAVTQTSKLNPNLISSSNNQNYIPDYQTKADPSVNDPGYVAPNTTSNTTSSVDPTQTASDIKLNSDGSVSLTVNGQNVNLTASVMSNLNTVFETVGSSGATTEVQKAIQKLIEQHKAEYPNSDVPVEMVFGKGDRSDTTNVSTNGNYSGAISGMNEVTLMVGTHAIVIQKDQTLEGQPITNGAIHTVEGNISGATFSGTLDGGFTPLTGTANGGYPNSLSGAGIMWNFNYDSSTATGI